MNRALLIEPQTLFAPYFAGVLEGAGSSVTVAGHVRERAVRELNPSLVVLDAASAGQAPLRVISGLRETLPHARIVVFARAFEPAWETLAHAMGADVIVGPSASESDLISAIAVA